MKLRLKIAEHDYQTKIGHVSRFLKTGKSVKITVMLRGREQSRPELAEALLAKAALDVVEFGKISGSIANKGRDITVVLNPKKK